MDGGGACWLGRVGGGGCIIDFNLWWSLWVFWRARSGGQGGWEGGSIECILSMFFVCVTYVIGNVKLLSGCASDK